MPAHTHIGEGRRRGGHLALLSILAATCFINQTNLEVITCPRQIDTRAASACTVRARAHKDFIGGGRDGGGGPGGRLVEIEEAVG